MLRGAISTCPNDTYAFAALLEGRVAGPDVLWELDDVEALNRGLAEDRYDFAKASFHAALGLSDRFAVLPVGAALGHGVGPLLLKARPDLPDRPGPGARVLCPGSATTASLLYRMFVPGGPEPGQVLFSAIQPALCAGRADYGVVIHEGRFTYAAQGLHLAADLGTLWEDETGAPLPLGGILARRDLPDPEGLVAAIRASLAAAHADPASALPCMRSHAQELDDRVLWQHVELYVNDRTMDLGDEGRRALMILAEKARAVGIAVPRADIVMR
ncbi:MAG: MqnA/MqnD/SBP family protein [Planctomycetota bacterium]